MRPSDERSGRWPAGTERKPFAPDGPLFSASVTRARFSAGGTGGEAVCDRVSSAHRPDRRPPPRLGRSAALGSDVPEGRSTCLTRRSTASGATCGLDSVAGSWRRSSPRSAGPMRPPGWARPSGHGGAQGRRSSLDAAPRFTVFHIDRSRGSEVLRTVLVRVIGCDFFGRKWPMGQGSAWPTYPRHPFLAERPISARCREASGLAAEALSYVAPQSPMAAGEVCLADGGHAAVFSNRCAMDVERSADSFSPDASSRWSRRTT